MCLSAQTINVCNLDVFFVPTRVYLLNVLYTLRCIADNMREFILMNTQLDVYTVQCTQYNWSKIYQRHCTWFYAIYKYNDIQ